MENNILDQNFERVIISIVRNNLEVSLANLLDSFDVYQIKKHATPNVIISMVAPYYSTPPPPQIIETLCKHLVRTARTYQ